MNGTSLPRTLIVGGILAVVPIALFLLLYLALQNAGIGDVPRLLIALCVPPLALAAVIGGYALVRRR